MNTYSARLLCRNTESTALIEDHIFLDDEDFLAMQVNGVRFTVELDGGLFLEGQDPPADAWFDSFYSERARCHVLADYVLTYEIPVRLHDAASGTYTDSTIAGRLCHADGALSTELSLLDAVSDRPDFTDALHELQVKLRDRYAVCICACCRWGQEHPYGGDAFLNYLCFRDSKERYARYSGVGKADWQYFQDPASCRGTCPVYRCEQFSPAGKDVHAL